jgi:CysZ protein
MGFLIRQEMPRNIIPVVLTLFIMVLGWFTPLGPVLTIVGPMVAAIFLAWDNTDLIPARNLQPFGQRFKAWERRRSFTWVSACPFWFPC